MCGSSVRGVGRWTYTECSYSGVRISGRFHSHVPAPFGCGGPDAGCPEPERHESIELKWQEVHDLLCRDQLALSL